VGLYGTWLLRPLLRGVAVLRVRAVFVILILLVALFRADSLTTLAEDELYADDIVYSASSPYQRILITNNAAGFQLFLNGNLQFSSADEYRYHEALVHPAMSAARAPRRVLILGGGDGLALREVLAHPSVEHVTLVDLDPEMTRLGKNFPPLGELSRHALEDRRVRVVNDDAMTWLEADREQWDVMVIDFPDPNTYALSKLYTKWFYTLVHARLAPGGAVGLQATSPLFARRAYWCVVETMRAAGLVVHGYQVPVPSFGVWGFALARRHAFTPPTEPPNVARKFLDGEALAAMFRFPADMTEVDVEINQLDN